MLTRPTLLILPSFDALKEQTFTFTVQSGGSQITANQLTIRSQKDNSIVYQNIQNTFKYQHTLPENTLTNGEYYNATVSVLNARGEQSVPSLPIQFRCFSTPTIKFTNIPTNDIINSASFNFKFRYEQSEGENFNEFIANLYNGSGALISSSKIVYVKDGRSPYEGEYLFAGFEDGAFYYVEIVGTTVNQTVVKSAKAKFTVSYARPSVFTLMTLKNNCEDGYISVSSNLVLIGSENYPDPPIYIDDKEIDLTGNGSYIKWGQGYTIANDFLVRAWFRKPTPYTTIIQFSNAEGQTIKIDYMRGYENVESQGQTSYVQATITSVDGMEYYIYSNYVANLSDERYYNLQFRRIKDIYQIELLEI